MGNFTSYWGLRIIFCLIASELEPDMEQQIGSTWGKEKKQRKTKEPLDESERGEWQSWPKTQHSEKEDYAIQSHQFIDGETVETVTFFWGAPKSLQMVTAAMKLKDTYSLGEKQWPN